MPLSLPGLQGPTDQQLGLSTQPPGWGGMQGRPSPRKGQNLAWSRCSRSVFEAYDLARRRAPGPSQHWPLRAAPTLRLACCNPNRRRSLPL